MSKIRYYVSEMNPSDDQQLLVHGFKATCFVNDKVTSVDLAKKLASANRMSEVDAYAAVLAIAKIMHDELLESNSVALQSIDGNDVVTVYPKVYGTITDTMVKDNPTKYNNATVATESMLTPDMLTVSAVATCGSKFSKNIRNEASLMKVSGKGGSTSAAVDGQVQISVSKNPSNLEGATLTGAGTYSIGDTVTLTASTVSGFNFQGWYLNNRLAYAGQSYTFEASESATYEARYNAQGGQNDEP